MGKDPKTDLERKQKDINLKGIKRLTMYSSLLPPPSLPDQYLSQEPSLYNFMWSFLTMKIRATLIA